LRLITLPAFVFALTLAAGSALAQGFPLMSFGEMGKLDETLAIRQHKTGARPGDLMFNPGENGGGRARAVYTGQSRPIDARHSAFITAFASTSVGNSSYAALYDRDYLFKAEGKDLWLPVQASVANFFAKELKAGQPVTLYVRNAGGFRLSDSWDWVFLVEEFDSPSGKGATPAEPAKPGQPPSKKAPVIPPGPKIAT
jgi:hypothetical protein